ncbi:ubiquitin-conjugating enzyme E2 variant 3-like isoform X1 [Ranitomeya variabilis]|uniref:ubiquitin-conjugating enzyme E2 variant 3-like isoform X1 n=1 Tax=Ranitomeya variabilis TaxID=490064 RepID=UPI004057BD47
MAAPPSPCSSSPGFCRGSRKRSREPEPDMEFISADLMRQRLVKYKFRDLTIEDLKDVHRAFPDFLYSVDTYTFTDGSQKDLLNLSGTVPMKFQGTLYNIPICLWILDSHPFAPPLCFLKPTQNMGIRVGKHVDSHGRIYLPSLQNWCHPKTTIRSLIKEMAATFEDELPLYSLSAAEASRQKELLTFISQVTDGVSGVDVSGKSRSKVAVIGGGDLALACLLALSAKRSMWSHITPLRDNWEADSLRTQICIIIIHDYVPAQRVADSLVLIDVSDGGSKGGGTTDLQLFTIPDVEISKDLSCVAGSKVIVITLNAWRSAQSYLEVLQSNVNLLRGFVPAVSYHCPNSVLVIASQPVEIMTYVAWKLSGLPSSQVIGIGCNLDSARFQHIVKTLTSSSEESQTGWVIGEQGANKVAAWSDPASENNDKPGKIYPKLFQEQLTNRAMEIIIDKGQRSWSIGLSVADLVDTIVQNKRKVHSVSSLAKGFFNIQNDVFLSVPCVLGDSGVLGSPQILQHEDHISDTLHRSAASIHNLQQQLNL